MRTDYTSNSIEAAASVNITNVGGGANIYKGLTAGVNELRTITASTGITASTVGDNVVVGLNLPNIGTGETLHAGGFLKSIKAGTNITIVPSTTELVINSSGSSNKAGAVRALIDASQTRGITSSGIVGSSIVGDNVSLNLAVSSVAGTSLINSATSGALQLKSINGAITETGGAITVKGVTNASGAVNQLYNGNDLRGISSSGALSSSVIGDNVNIALGVSSIGGGTSLVNSSAGSLALNTLGAGSNIGISNVAGLITLSSVTNLNTATGTLQTAQEPAHTGDVTNPAGSLVLTVAPNAITNAKVAQMPTLTIKGNNTAGTANASDLTAAQVKTLLAITSSDVSGLGTLATQSTVSLTTQATGVLQAAQEPAHTGDVTNTAGSLVLTIATNAVTNTKAAQMPANTFKGNNTGGTANPSDLTTTQAKTLLAITSADVSGLGLLATQNTVSLTSQATGTLQAAQTGALTGDVTSTAGSYATTIANNAVTNAKAAQMPTLTIKGNSTAGTANASDLTATQAKTLLAITSSDVSGLGALATLNSVSLTTQATGTLQAAQEPAHTGDVTNTAGSLALTIASSAVTNTKQANMPTLTIKANNTGSSTAPQDVGYSAIISPLLDTISSTAGAITYRDASTWQGLAPGTSGQILSSNGASAPTWINNSPFVPLTGDVTTSGSVATIPVNTVTNTKAAQMPANTFKGNNTGVTANASDLTVPQVKTLLAYDLSDITGTLSTAQEPAHTGDVTNTAGSLVLTIANNAVTNAKAAQMPTLTLKGNSTAGTANASDLTATQAKTLLAITSTDVSGLGALATLNTVSLTSQATGTLQAAQTGALTGDVTSTAGSYATTIATNAVTNAKAAQMPTLTLKGNDTAGTTNASDLTATQAKTLLAITSSDVSGLGTLATLNSVSLTTQATGTLQAAQEPAHTGDVTNTAGSLVLTVANNAVTNTKAAQMPANTFKGNNTGATTNASDLTTTQAKTLLAITSADVSGLGALATLNTVSLTTQATGTLQAAQTGALTGDVTSTAGSYATTIGTGVVTNTKAATMPTLTIKANNTGATTAPQDVGYSAIISPLLDTISSTAGAITYRGASAWQGLAPGTSGQVLSSNGASAPTWINNSSFVPLTGDVTTSGAVATIANNAVTNTKAAQMPTLTIKGNNTVATANALDLTAAQVKTLLAITFTDVSGSLPASQIGALTGDVTSTAGSYATTIANNAVTNTKAAQMPTLTLKGNNTGVTANAIDLTATQAKTLLAITSADVSGLGALATQSTVSLTTQATGTLQAAQTGALTGDVTSTAGSYATTISNNAVTNTKAAQMPTLTLKGNNTAGTANATDLTAAQTKTLLAITSADVSGLGALATLNTVSLTTQATGTLQAAQTGALTGDVTSTAGSYATTIATNAVTNTKAAQMPANTFKGNNTGATANASDLTTTQAKTLLAITSTDVSGLGALATLNTVSLTTQATGVLQAAQEPAHTGDVTNTAGSLALTIANNAVTNAKAAQMPTLTIKSNVTGATANAIDNTITQILDSVASSAPGAVITRNATNWVGLNPGAVNTVLSSLGVGQPLTFANIVVSLSGDVTTSSNVATIANNAVTNAKAAQMPTLTIKGNNTVATANALDLTAVQVKTLLAITSADVSGLGVLATLNTVSLTTQATGVLQAAQEPAHTGDVTNTAGSLALTIANNAVTNAKAAQMPANTFKGNNTGATANASDLTAAQVKTLLAITSADVSGLGTLATLNSVSLTTQATGVLQAAQEPAHTGDVTNTAGSLVLTVANNAVTNAKAAQMPTGTIKSNLTGTTADPSDNTFANVINSLLDTLVASTAGAMVYRGISSWSSINPGSIGQVLTMITASIPGWVTPLTTLSSLIGATAVNSINSTTFAQTWNWSTATTQNPMTMTAAALTTGSLLTLTPAANSTALACNGRLLTAVGTTTNTTPVQTTGTINDFMENKIKNASTGLNAQSGFTAEADNGGAFIGFAWMGINSSAFNNPQTYNAGVAGDVTYIGSGQDMIIANANQTKAIKFQTGKAATPFFDDRVAILNSGLMGINTITPTSHLDVNGSIGWGIRSDAAATVTVALTDTTIILPLAGAQTVTLPNASLFQRRILTLTNSATIQKTTNLNYFNQYLLSSSIISPFSTITLQSDGSNWRLINSIGLNKPSFKVTHGSVVSVPSGVATVIPYNSITYDLSSGGFSSGQIVNGVFTCAAPGIYTFSAGVNFNVTSTMAGDVFIEVFNQTTSESTRSGMYLTGTLGSYYGTITTDMSLAVGNTVVVRVTQNSGIARNTGAGASLTWFTGRLVT